MSTHVATAVAPQDFEPQWRKGGVIPIDIRGRSRPPRRLEAQPPGRSATEQKRILTGPEYLTHRLSTRPRSSLTYPTLNISTIQTPQSTVTASFDGLVGFASSELVVLASPRSTRCLYCYKDFRCLTKARGKTGCSGLSNRRFPMSHSKKSESTGDLHGT